MVPLTMQHIFRTTMEHWIKYNRNPSTTFLLFGGAYMNVEIKVKICGT